MGGSVFQMPNMTAEFLQWFLAQTPFRKCRLVMSNGTEHIIEKPEHVYFIGNGNVLVGRDLGMGRRTVALAEIEEVRR
jgi:hypothetical protein